MAKLKFKLSCDICVYNFENSKFRTEMPIFTENILTSEDRIPYGKHIGRQVKNLTERELDYFSMTYNGHITNERRIN